MDLDAYLDDILSGSIGDSVDLTTAASVGGVQAMIGTSDGSPPQLPGKVVRGKIGVQIELVPRENYQEDFGLKTRSGVLVKAVVPAGPAE